MQGRRKEICYHASFSTVTSAFITGGGSVGAGFDSGLGASFVGPAAGCVALAGVLLPHPISCPLQLLISTSRCLDLSRYTQADPALYRCRT